MRDRESGEQLLPLLNDIFHQVKDHFLPWPDRGEEWRMPPPGYDGSQPLRDDCDGFCLACRSLLRRQRIRSRLVYCKVEGRDHLVVEVEGWIMDNLQDTVVANTLLSARDYRWLRISGFTPGEPWREITGLGL